MNFAFIIFCQQFAYIYQDKPDVDKKKFGVILYLRYMQNVRISVLFIWFRNTYNYDKNEKDKIKNKKVNIKTKA